MADTDGVFLFLATYPDEATAQADYEVVKALHTVSAVGNFDAAVITKDSAGKVHINKDETTTRKGAWGGVAVGAVIGIVFPPSIIATAVVGGGIGAVAGHLKGGMSRSDVKELSEFMEDDSAALLVIGELTLSEAIEKAELRAVRQYRKQVDVDTKELEKEIKAANKS